MWMHERGGWLAGASAPFIRCTTMQSHACPHISRPHGMACQTVTEIAPLELFQALRFLCCCLLQRSSAAAAQASPR
jgi:hypothetical protein